MKRVAARTIDQEAWNIKLAILLFCAITILLFLLVCFLLTEGYFTSGQLYATDVGSNGQGVMWRYTSNGWQDVAALIVPAEASPSWVRRIHPLVLAACVLIASLKAAVWLSCERDLLRLWGQAEVSSKPCGCESVSPATQQSGTVQEVQQGQQ